MENLKIGTWNIKNSYSFFSLKNDVKADAVLRFLKIGDLDILALQEVSPLLAVKIEEKLKGLNKGYQITSAYNKTINPIKNLRVEYNMIISRLTPTSLSIKDSLPSIPRGFRFVKNLFDIRKRNIVSQVFENEIIVSNTHLDHKFEDINHKQLEEVKNLIELQSIYGHETILIGNLNVKPIDENMINFTKELSKLGMKVVENNNNTYNGHTDNLPVDYVAVPKNWEIEKVSTINCSSEISSHNPVFVKVRKK